jgi:hypothetical protein
MATPAPVEIGSLVGLERVAGLIVEELDSEVVKNGLSSADVRAEIEVLLYKYGLLKRDSNLFGPFLHVQVGTYKIENTFAFTIRLEFIQKMRFARTMPKSSSRLLRRERSPSCRGSFPVFP